MTAHSGPPSVRMNAYAKLNLSLDVLGRREDGFHELRSVMQTVSLHDTLTVRFGGASEPVGRDHDYSLIDRAILAVLEHVGRKDDMSYSVVKRIPAAAGLGGGSADAAAALKATVQLLGVSLSDADLVKLGASLGSDVPFFLWGGTALVEGRGERVTPLTDIPRRWFLLCNQREAVSTKDVFTNLREDEWGRGQATQSTLAGLARDAVVIGGNDLEAPAKRVSSSIDRTLTEMGRVAEVSRIGMSGSGGTCFALYDSEDEAMAAQLEITSRQMPWSSLSSSMTRNEIEDAGPVACLRRTIELGK